MDENGEAVVTLSKCSDRLAIYQLMVDHKLRIRYKKKDDKENEYWVYESLPDVGKAMSLYIREVTTIDEDFHYLFGYAFLGLFTELSETPGVRKDFVVS